MPGSRGLAPLVLLAVVGGCNGEVPTGAPDGGMGDGAGCLVWPNEVSRANSDPWLAEHHDELCQMRPRVMVLNFDDDTLDPKRMADYRQLPPAEFAARIAESFDEGSRYHGYLEPGAPRFLAYDIAHVIDLTDGVVDGNLPLHNSKLLPRRPNPQCPSGQPSCNPYRLNYSALFTAEYAARYDLRDASGRLLDLCQLFQTGRVHEVWIYADQDHVHDTGIDESLEAKQTYDESGAKVAFIDPGAGNGGFQTADEAAVTSCGVTVRFMGINPSRGVGCMNHAAGHGIESAFRGGDLPWIATDFRRFAGFDMNDRFGAPFESWYWPCMVFKDSHCVEYPEANTASWTCDPGTFCAGQQGTMSPLDQGCGNVHFPPNARYHYDYASHIEVQATCARFGLGGQTLERYPWEYADQYEKAYGDCGGGWMVYWRQNFPGLGNRATASNGKPMKNWWPYLFY